MKSITACSVLVLLAVSLTAQNLVPKLKKSCLAGEAPWIYYATLFDRLQVIRGLPQRYATQMKRAHQRPPISLWKSLPGSMNGGRSWD